MLFDMLTTAIFMSVTGGYKEFKRLWKISADKEFKREPFIFKWTNWWCL